VKNQEGVNQEAEELPLPQLILRVLSKGTNYIIVQWDPSIGAVSYKLDLATDPNFLSFSCMLMSRLIILFIIFSKYFRPSTTYHVRVKAINNYGESSYAYLYNITTFSQISYDSFVKGFTNTYGVVVSDVFWDNIASLFQIAAYYRSEESEAYTVLLKSNLDGDIIKSNVLRVSSPDIFQYPIYFFTALFLDDDNYLMTGPITKNVTTTINPYGGYSLVNVLFGKFTSNLSPVWSKSIGKGLSGTYYPIYCDFEGERFICGYDPESSDTVYNEEVKKIIPTSDGFLLIGNLSVATYWPLKDPGQSKAYGYPLIIKTDREGIPIYAKIIKIPNYLESNHGYISFNDGVKIGDFYYLVGTFVNTTTVTHPYPFHSRDVMLAKMDEQGNIHWLKFYQISTGADLGSRILQMLDGTLLITGTNGFQGTYDPYLLKIDLNGNVIKGIVITPATPGVINGGEGGYDLTITSDNNYAMIAGGASGAVVFAKFNSNLNILNTSVFRIGEDQWTTKVREVNNRFYVIGEFNNAAPFECVIGPSGTIGIFMAKLNQEHYLSGCACSGTSTIITDITNQIISYTKTYEVIDYKYSDEPMYSEFPTSSLMWQTNFEATSTQYCPYDYYGYNNYNKPIERIKNRYITKLNFFEDFLDVFDKLMSMIPLKYLLANLKNFIKY